ncbi:hypothetical protein GCM10010435_45430 [Winogradskya consettensis]|uniref:Uncharacterized protein n=1 Tax=Winogradskya consettensis TaxID=113560 RepID=A0A919T048_9ACTN|nr:hypothetical protein Aco04nite_83820 [Actinoplanes consettensis]
MGTREAVNGERRTMMGGGGAVCGLRDRRGTSRDPPPSSARWQPPRLGRPKRGSQTTKHEVDAEAKPCIQSSVTNICEREA